MNAFLRALATTALVAGTTLLGGMSSSVVEAQSSQQGSVAITVILTGDPGGDVGNVLLTIDRQSGSTATSAPAVAGGNTFTLPFGSYVLVPTVTDPNYAIASYSCVSQQGNGTGPSGPDFVIDGNGAGDFVAATCTVNVTYTAPPTDSTTPPTVPPTDSTAPPVTTPPVETTVAPAPPSTDVIAALPPAAESDSDTTAGTTSGTMPVTGPTDQTLPIAVTGLMMLLLGTGAVVAARRR
jgi:hypothetical protein